jgi:alkylation response protein AidB-like acyl-CoA dehydrogenase
VDFSLTEEQERYREEVLRFARAELNQDLISRDEESSFPAEAWKRCATFGLQGLPVPEDYGGSGADPLTIMVAMEALGQGCRDNGLLFSLNAQMWSCEMPLVRAGSEEQKRRYLPGLCDGSLIGSQAMTEPGTGSDAFALGTRAVRRGEGYVLTGSKTFVTNAPVAELFIVFAVTDPTEGIGSLSAFLVDRDTPGLTVGEPLHKMGLRTSPMGELFLSDC